VISREDIRDGALMRMVAACNGLLTVHDDDFMAASVAQTLAEAPPEVRLGGDAWVFGYGSLMWNPAMLTAERRIATIHGYHRRFCLWTPAGRGTPENPGLVLGLARGGACKGVAYRIRGPQVEEEFSILWRREMVSDGYCPRWVRMTCEGESLSALTFVINREAPRYAGRLSDQQAAEAIAKAIGDLGTNAEYLLSTVTHLDEIGIPDRRLHALKTCLLKILSEPR
jgi:cation transport protein ChaC